MLTKSFSIVSIQIDSGKKVVCCDVLQKNIWVILTSSYGRSEK